MMTFGTLSPLVRALFALSGLTLCLINIGNFVLAAIKKRFRYTAFALLLFALAYFIWQSIFDYSLFLLGKTESVKPVTEALCGVPWAYWLAVSALLMLLSLFLLGLNIRYDRTFITPGTIKLYLDRMPCGVCCWRENGFVVFSNIRMNELCKAVTGNYLLNGNHFSEAAAGRMITVDGKVWRFLEHTITTDSERLKEMIATDITDEHAKIAALERDKADLSVLNKELQEYYLGIDEAVKRREILQAKMNIHDEMNRLMLSTMAVDKTDAGALDGIFSLWEQNALLLCMEADRESSGRQSETLSALAGSLGIDIVWREALPQTLNDRQKELFFFTAQEAVINAVKHAQAKNMEISFEQNSKALVCRFENDGKMPRGEVHFEGGLANIARLAEKQNASIRAETGERFSLVLSINLKYQPIG